MHTQTDGRRDRQTDRQHYHVSRRSCCVLLHYDRLKLFLCCRPTFKIVFSYSFGNPAASVCKKLSVLNAALLRRAEISRHDITTEMRQVSLSYQAIAADRRQWTELILGDWRYLWLALL